MKIGTLVTYSYDKTMGVITCLNTAGGTIQILTTEGKLKWCVASQCEVNA